ncbi:phage antirepressor KilAC domain-containing protein [Microbulbifer sp. GL-2]|uniref:phage antirepressor KilAC domain-containing protein n=1 Tax=Microbulbifer sp. GL-2 TaxID=2591606 RepID=UPI0011629F30|nr:phage antirepressor KilAC domain-containing protein [Microbulbifer sp. GL-2]BBM00473.1 hypothetical protein GL2_05470 [Microbulbifer sp. GL-2]
MSEFSRILDLYEELSSKLKLLESEREGMCEQIATLSESIQGQSPEQKNNSGGNMKKEKLLTITQAARAVKIGRNNLLKVMRENGLLHESEPMRNSPTKYAVRQRLLVPKTSEFNRGPVTAQYITALVTAKGIVWIRDLIEKPTIPQAS